VPEVPEEPPEPLGAAHHAVRDDEHALADPRTGSRRREVVRIGQRVPPALPGRSREVLVDVEERRAGDVPLEVELTSALRVAELPPAVDELVARGYQFPPGDDGSGTFAGWTT
jgi:hypothetical protein